MPPHIQTNKEFVDAAGIAEQDAFLAIGVRRTVARMLEIPAQKLTAEMTFESVIWRAEDWDALDFGLHLMEQFPIDIGAEEWLMSNEAATVAGYPNWFYNPHNYVQFSFLWKPFVPSTPQRKMTFGEWVKLVVEVVLSPFRDRIDPPADWPGLEASDLESDAVAEKNPACAVLRFMGWGILGLIAIGTIILLGRWFL